MKSLATLPLYTVFWLAAVPRAAAAGDLSDFEDKSFGRWDARPAFIGRTAVPGWSIVSNAGEQAARNSPTESPVSYYWKLTRTFDLTELTSSQLEVKFDFRGHQYLYFRIAIGDENASNLADFTTLHEETAATGVKTEKSDLSAYVGSVVRVQLLLRKPRGVTERRIGVYVHSILVSTPEPVSDCTPYSRSLYRHWVDADRDCQNTRQEALIKDNSGALTFATSRDCRVATGTWLDPYTRRTFTQPLAVDVDHVVPLKEAHQSGGWQWNAEQRKAYANDLGDASHLLSVMAAANRSKGAKDPAQWLPPDTSYWVEYAKIWVAIKVRWNLTADREELDVLEMLLAGEGDVQLPQEAPEYVCSG